MSKATAPETDTPEVGTVSDSTALVLDTPELNALEKSKSEQIRAVFAPMADLVAGFEGEYKKVMAAREEGVTPELSQQARKLRLAIKKVRTDAENARKALKQEYLIAGRAVDGTNNILRWAISEKEEALQQIENHAALMEQQRIQALQDERVTALAPYVEDAGERDLGSMDDDVWAAYFAAKQQAHEDRIAAEKKAEAERVEAELVAALGLERERQLRPFYGHYEEPGVELGTLTNEEYVALIQGATEAKAAHDAEQERIRAENERLAKEAAEAEAKAAKEREAAEKKAAAERAKAEAALKAERERAAAAARAAEAEREKERAAARAEQAKAEAAAKAEREKAAKAAEAAALVGHLAAAKERERREALEAAEAKRIAAEKEATAAAERAAAEAAKAPVKARLTAWIDSFTLPELPGEDHEVAETVRAKFVAFKGWAAKEVEKV